MYHKWWDGSSWSGWENLGGYCLVGPVSASWAPNRIDTFVIGRDHAMYHKWWDGFSWSGWENLGGYCLVGPVSTGDQTVLIHLIGGDQLCTTSGGMVLPGVVGKTLGGIVS